MMSLNQVRKTFHRHLLLDSYSYYLPFSSSPHPSSSPFHSDFCFSTFSSSPSSLSSSSISCSSFHSSQNSTDSLEKPTTTGIYSDPSDDNHSDNYTSYHIGSTMDLMDLSDNHCRILKATLEANKRQYHLPHKQSHLKGKSPVGESLQYKATAAALSTPSLSSTLAATSSATATATTSPRSTLLKSKIQIATLSCCTSFSSFSSTAKKLSPLDLPSEIFLYLLKFLAPHDLWRLCQCSRTMHIQVIGFMSKIHTFQYGAVRILHQENLPEDAPTTDDTSLLSPPRLTPLARRRKQGSQPTFYERMTATIRSPGTLYLTRLAESEAAEKQAKGERTTHDRSSYWLAQARFLVGTIMEGTEYEPKHETVRTRESGGYSGNSNNSNMVRIYHITDDVTPPLHDYAPNLQQQQEGEGEELNLAADTGGSNTSQQQDPIDDGGNTSIATNSNTPSITLVTGPLPPSTTSQVTHALDLPPSAVSPFPSTTQAGVAISEAASTVGLNAEGKFKGPSPGSLPEERLLAMVDLLFDPNLVDLYHRRAVINCARYVSAKIDDIFMRAFQITDPYNPDFHALFQDRCHVQTGPYLTMYAPVLYDDDGLELTAQEQALIGRASSKSIAPPRKLSNFQMLLWHRCLSDLIKLYHRIQDRHLPEGPKQPSHHRRKSKRLSSLSSSLSSSSSPVCCQEPPRRRSSHLDDATPEPCRKSYPMCCHAHSLVFSTEYSSFSLVPYPVRVHFRRIVNRVQSASQRTLWSVSNLGRSQGLLTRRVIEYTGPKERLRFCSGSVHPPNYNIVSSSSASECENGGGQLRKQQQDTESLIQQRLRVEESIRQDTLMKQELLALCHMACGLFLTEERNLDTPPTIMSLLRQGGPWNKGIWREGEWRRSAIDPSVTSASTSLSSISSKVKGKKYTMTSNSSDDNNEYAMDQGRWQKICLATIQFLAHEDLAWGGNRTNAELSRLRTTNNATAWVYHE